MQHRLLVHHSRIAPIVCIVSLALSVGDVVAQTTPMLREWVDATGQFKLNAVYVGRVATGVVLRREDGTELTVPVDKLSTADQKYLETLSAPKSPSTQPAGPPATSPQPATVPSALANVDSDVLIIVQSIVDGKVVAHATGVVTLVDGDRAEIAILDGRLGTAGGQADSGPAPKFIALVGPAGKEKQVELEGQRVTGRGPTRSWWLTGPKDQLPPPIKLGPLPAVAVGQQLVSLGARMFNDSNRTEAQRMRIETKVERLMTSPTGEAVGFGIGPGVTGVLLDERGEVIAVHLGEAGRSRVYPTLILDSRRTIDLQALRIRETRLSPNEVKLEFVLQTFDVHPSLHGKQAPRLLITHLPPERAKQPDYEYLNDRERFVVSDGRWTKKTEGTELDMQPVTTVDAEFDVPPSSADRLHAALWSAEYKFPLDQKLAPVFYQVAVVDAETGKIIRLLDTDSHVKVPKEQPLPILFRHPVNQYDQGTPLLPKHPGGGVLLTVDNNPPSLTSLLKNELPKPVPGPGSLIKEVRTEQGMAIAPLTLRPQVRAQIGQFDRGFHQLSTPIVASPDGKFLYLVDGNEGSVPKLHKVDVASWKSLLTLSLRWDCRSIALARGALIVDGGQQEFFLVDPETLEIKTRLPKEHSQIEVAARPDQDTAYVLLNGGMFVLDVKTATAKKFISTDRFASAGVGIRGGKGPLCSLWLSPDGRYLFLGNDRIHRMRIDGSDVIYEGSGPPLPGSAVHRLVIDDGLGYAGLPLGKSPPGIGDKLALYDPKNLSQVRRTLDVGPVATALAFEGPDGAALASTSSRHVMRFDAAGNIIAGCQLALDEEIRRIFVIPNHGAAVFWGDVVYVVDANVNRLSALKP